MLWSIQLLPGSVAILARVCDRRHYEVNTLFLQKNSPKSKILTHAFFQKQYGGRKSKFNGKDNYKLCSPGSYFLTVQLFSEVKMAAVYEKTPKNIKKRGGFYLRCRMSHYSRRYLMFVYKTFGVLYSAGHFVAICKWKTLEISHQIMSKFSIFKKTWKKNTQ